jgi:hypothetical protein
LGLGTEVEGQEGEVAFRRGYWGEGIDDEKAVGAAGALGVPLRSGLQVGRGEEEDPEAEGLRGVELRALAVLHGVLGGVAPADNRVSVKPEVTGGGADGFGKAEVPIEFQPGEEPSGAS